MIYTSYFAMLKKLPKGIKRVAITRWTPKWYHGCASQKLAPPANVLAEYKKTGDFNKFSRRYYEEVLEHRNVDELLSYLKNKLRVDPLKEDIVLLCYERSDSPCHRHLVRDWLNKNGVPCEEYKFDK